jgi:hypothetical protein
LLGVSEKYKWNKITIERYGMLNLTIVSKAIYDKRSNIDQNVYEVMLPIFIRENTLCFTFYMIYCKGMCSIGEITIHKKKMASGNAGFDWQPFSVKPTVNKAACCYAG